MTTTPHQDGLPALPEPTGSVYRYAKNHTPRIEWFRRPGDIGAELFTADQMRAYALAALAAQPLPVQEAVHQFRKKHCSDWYDGHPDPSDGGGPYECRTLYAQPASPECKPLTGQGDS